jgi:hypothetical protein
VEAAAAAANDRAPLGVGRVWNSAAQDLDAAIRVQSNRIADLCEPVAANGSQPSRPRLEVEVEHLPEGDDPDELRAAAVRFTQVAERNRDPA